MSAVRDLLLSNEAALAEAVDLLRRIERSRFDTGGAAEVATGAAREIGAPLGGIESSVKKHGAALTALLGQLLEVAQETARRPAQPPAELRVHFPAAAGWEFEVTEYLADGSIKKLVAKRLEA